MRSLTPSELVHFLVQRHLVRPASVIKGNLRVVEASQRNCNFKVIINRGRSYFLKQGVDPDHAATIAREAKLYQLLQSAQNTQQIRRYLPRFLGYDEAQGILILEYIPRAQDLR